MPNILITGASGFVGSWLVSEALSRELDVYAGIRKTSNTSYISDDRIHFQYLNYTDADQLVKDLKTTSFDYIIHNAGVVRALDKQTFFDVNFGYTRNLIEAIKLSGTPIKKFIYISSLAACGPADNEPEGKITPNIVCKPPTHYGQSKLLAEEYIQSSNLPYLIFRATAVYGPRDQDILKLFKGIKSGVAPIIGIKASKLSFIYVKDLARLILDAILSDINKRHYVVSDGATYAGDQLQKTVASIMGKRAIFPKVPLPLVSALAVLSELKSKLTKQADTFDIDKVNELKPRNWVCDISELKKDFNFAARNTFEESLRETYRWYKKHNWI